MKLVNPNIYDELVPEEDRDIVVCCALGDEDISEITLSPKGRSILTAEFTEKEKGALRPKSFYKGIFYNEDTGKEEEVLTIEISSPQQDEELRTKLLEVLVPLLIQEYKIAPENILVNLPGLLHQNGAQLSLFELEN